MFLEETKIFNKDNIVEDEIEIYEGDDEEFLNLEIFSFIDEHTETSLVLYKWQKFILKHS